MIVIAEILIVVGVLGAIVAGTVILSEIYDLIKADEEGAKMKKTLSDLYAECSHSRFEEYKAMLEQKSADDRMRAKWNITRRHKTRSRHRKFVKVKR